MNYFLLSFILLLIIFGIGLIYIFVKRIDEKNKVLIEWLKSSNNNINQQLSSVISQFHLRLNEAMQSIIQLQKNISEVVEVSHSMQEWQKYLFAPKLRGNIGEQILDDILKQYFPKEVVKFQYQFKNGEKVDALIITSQGLIPIDAKFPLEKFGKYLKAQNEKEKKEWRRGFVNDVKKHLETIAKKYILPEEKTVDYAIMYVPSETVFYEIISDEEIFNYAHEKRVFPVSPMSFFAFIKTILLSFEGEKIQSKAKQILILLQTLKKDYQKTYASFNILNRHLTNAYHQSHELTKQLDVLGQKINTSLIFEDHKNKLLEPYETKD